MPTNINSVEIQSVTYPIYDSRFGTNTTPTVPDPTPTTWYGTSSTTASTAEKAVACYNYVLKAGAIIGVLFSTANTAALPTLNINSTGARGIFIGSNVALNSTSNVLKWSANTMVYFMYDGSYYRYITSVSAGSVAPSRGANTWYGTSNTTASTQAKVSTIDNYVLTKGSLISIYFSTANTYTSAKITLNVNSTGAKDVYYNGAVTSSTNTCTWPANTTVTFIYDGTGYQVIAMSNYDNKYSAVGHTHSTSDITGLGTAATTAIGDYAAASHSHSWGDITNPPASYTPSSHTHDYSKVSFTQTKTSGTEIGKITIDGTTTSLYYSDSNDKVYQSYVTQSPSNLPYQMVFSQQLSGTTDSVTGYLNRSNKLTVKYTGDAAINVSNSSNDRSSSLQYNKLYLADPNSDYSAIISTGITLTASRTYKLPNQGGTIALVSDIPTYTTTSTAVATAVSSNGTTSALTGVKFTSTTTALTSITASTTSIYPAANVTALTSVTSSTTSVYGTGTATVYGSAQQSNVMSAPTVVNGVLSWTLVTTSNGTAVTVSNGTSVTVVNAVTVPNGKSVRDTATTVATGNLTTGTATVGTAVGANGTSTVLTGVKVSATTNVISSVTAN